LLQTPFSAPPGAGAVRGAPELLRGGFRPLAEAGMRRTGSPRPVGDEGWPAFIEGCVLGSPTLSTSGELDH
jgi:hypothetical protein